MASVKVKFRPSTIEGKTGALYFQVIHRRIVRSQKTKYKIYPDEWNARIWGIERSGFFNGREKWAKGFENQRV